MAACGTKCKKATAFGFAGLFLVFGVVLLAVSNTVIESLIEDQLKLTNVSTSFKIWKDVPIPIYFEIYMFNWTNSEQVLKDWRIKPKFEECGPYTFLEKHIRVNLKWHNNGTVTYQQKRFWHFLPERSNGSLSDQIINVNPIAATVSYLVKDMNYFVQKGIDLFLEEKEKSLAMKKTVNESLFVGYKDDLLALIRKLNISAFKVPFDEFGWFYNRNGSETYDGTFNMYTGEKDISMLGIIEDWNGAPSTDNYGQYCNYVNGTSGELWPPYIYYKSISLFAPDICSSISITYNTSEYIRGIKGRVYVGDESVFDNGSKYPQMACFYMKNAFPSGVRDVSKCKFGAPAFVSYPHFYLADRSYRDKITGMNPSQEKHQFQIILEPLTGIPLDVKAQLQLNLLIQPVPHLKMFKDVKQTFMPMLWFRQSALVTPDLADQAKLLLTVPNLFLYTGLGFLSIGIFIMGIIGFIYWKKAWKGSDTQNLIEEESQ